MRTFSHWSLFYSFLNEDAIIDSLLQMRAQSFALYSKWGLNLSPYTPNEGSIFRPLLQMRAQSFALYSKWGLNLSPYTPNEGSIFRPILQMRAQSFALYSKWGLNHSPYTPNEGLNLSPFTPNEELWTCDNFLTQELSLVPSSGQMGYSISMTRVSKLPHF